MLDAMAFAEDGLKYSELSQARQAYFKTLLQQDLRKNTYDAESNSITVSELRGLAIKNNMDYYAGLFTNEESLVKTREAYAIPENTIKDELSMKKMNAFFFWAAWACVTERPGKDITYTSNWPHEELVGNTATSKHLFWSIFSIMVLLAGIGLVVLYYARNQEKDYSLEKYPEKDPLINLKATPSMKATLKYFWIVSGLLGLQVVLGILIANYGVEGGGFYGLSLDTILPYSISRTWHVQLAIF